MWDVVDTSAATEPKMTHLQTLGGCHHPGAPPLPPILAASFSFKGIELGKKNQPELKINGLSHTLTSHHRVLSQCQTSDFFIQQVCISHKIGTMEKRGFSDWPSG